jgi:neurocan core protein
VDADGRYLEKQIDVIVYIRPALVPGVPRKFEGEQSQQFSLPCRARGLPEPKYIFYKDANENSVHSTDRIEVDGDAGNVHFRPLHKDDEGKYRCVAFNEVGHTEQELELRVIVPPTIYNVKNVTQAEGGTITIVCLSYGDPAPSMSFRKAGSAVEYQMGDNEGGRIVMMNPDSGRLELTIKNLVPSDMSNYTCKSVNIAGYHEINGTITVNFGPRFPPDHITEVFTWAGKTRNITCHILAEPLPVIEWLHNGFSLVNNETYRIYIMSKDTNLQVTVREADQGWVYGPYTCKARNDYGTGSLPILLSRANYPDRPRNVTGCFRSTTIIKLCVVPPADNGGVEVFAYRVDYDQGKVLEFQLGEEMIVENLHASTTYVFRVRARNEVGVGEPETTMVRTDDIRAPSTLVLTSEMFSPSAYEYIVSWKKPETGGMPIIEYNFRLRKLRGPPDASGPDPISDWLTRHRAESYDNPSLYYNLRDLEPATWYQLEVTAYNNIGWSPPNDLFYFRTAEGDLAYPPAGPDEIIGGGAPTTRLSTLLSTLLCVLFALVFGQS